LAQVAGDDGTADEEIRNIVRQTGVQTNGQHPKAFCFVNANPIAFEVLALVKAGKTLQEALLETFNNDRNCKSWYPYTPGASPLWHYEEMRMMFLEVERRQHDEAIEEERRDFQTALAEQRKKFDAEMEDRDAAENTRLNKFATKVAIAIGTTGVAAAVIIGLIQIVIALHTASPTVKVTVVVPSPIAASATR